MTPEITLNLVFLVVVIWVSIFFSRKAGTFTCVRGEKVHGSRYITIVPGEAASQKNTYCKEHFLEAVVQMFASCKPVIFCEPSPENLSAFFTHDEWWGKNNFLEEDWVHIQALLRATRKEKPILWADSSEVNFPIKITDSFFHTEQPNLTPFNPQELAQKLNEIFTKKNFTSYTLQIPDDIGIIVTP